MSIRSARLAFILALLVIIFCLWSCGGDSISTTPAEAVIRSTGNSQSRDPSPSVPVRSVRSKPAGINTSVKSKAAGTNYTPIFNSHTVDQSPLSPLATRKSSSSTGNWRKASSGYGHHLPIQVRSDRSFESNPCKSLAVYHAGRQ